MFDWDPGNESFARSSLLIQLLVAGECCDGSASEDIQDILILIMFYGIVCVLRFNSLVVDPNSCMKRLLVLVCLIGSLERK